MGTLFTRKRLLRFALSGALLLFIGLCIYFFPALKIYLEVEPVRKFYKLHGKPPEFSWRTIHKNETYEPFGNYIIRDPFSLTPKHDKIYILPLGSFTEKQKEIVTETCHFVEAIYGMNVVQLPVRKMPDVPDSMKRDIGITQYKTGYFIDSYLSINEYSDAAVLIALTSEDLFPSESWNYVFGLASFYERVGVWSMRRLGYPDNDTLLYRLCLERTCKIATHEIGHMFCLKHCVRYPCIMNGSNGLGETDITPQFLCPDCLEKMAWNLETTPSAHFKRMLAYWESKKDTAQVAIYTQLLTTAHLK